MYANSSWSLLLCFGLLCLLACAPSFRKADKPPIPAKHRLANLDGLRGILAFAVFFHHAVVYHYYLLTGIWTLPPSHFYAMIGPLAVAVFFMITGYLFWGQLLKTEGRPHWARLYIGRVFRIGPVYIVAALMMILLSLGAQGFHLKEPLSMVVRSSLYWLALGIAPWCELNGDGFPDIWLAGVSWSIKYEWFFYISLPVLALLARRRRWATFGLFIALVMLLIRPAARSAVGAEVPGSVLVIFFLTGMLCASLQESGFKVPLADKWMSCVAVTVIGLSFLAPAPFTWLPAVTLGVFFLLVVNGCTLFGLLHTKPTRRMGDVSYGIYLLQGFALAAVFRLYRLDEAAKLSVPLFWILTFVAGAILMIFATLAHFAIERPGIEYGRRLARRFAPNR